VNRLLLVRHGSTDATRAAAFPVDEPLDERGRAAAAHLAASLPHGCEVFCSPALRCRQTAEAAGLKARIDANVIECDFGSWAGLTLDQVDTDGARAWMSDAASAPHGGESLRDFAGRIAGWLDAQARSAIVITHGGVVRASVVHALGAPLDAFWRIEVAPLSVTELQRRDASWTVKRVNDAVAA
jgi:broad specificity phosphatase PhoE